MVLKSHDTHLALDAGEEEGVSLGACRVEIYLLGFPRGRRNQRGRVAKKRSGCAPSLREAGTMTGDKGSGFQRAVLYSQVPPLPSFRGLPRSPGLSPSSPPRHPPGVVTEAAGKEGEQHLYWKSVDAGGVE